MLDLNNNDERENALLLAGQIAGMACRLTEEQWRDLANNSDLYPENRKAVLALADFRGRLTGETPLPRL